MRQRLTPSGGIEGDAPFDLQLTKRLYRAMVFARTYDRKGMALQKQGRLATYAPFEGQEAAQIGAAAGLVAGVLTSTVHVVLGHLFQLAFTGELGQACLGDRVRNLAGAGMVRQNGCGFREAGLPMLQAAERLVIELIGDKRDAVFTVGLIPAMNLFA